MAPAEGAGLTFTLEESADLVSWSGVASAEVAADAGAVLLRGVRLSAEIGEGGAVQVHVLRLPGGEPSVAERIRIRRGNTWWVVRLGPPGMGP